MDLLKVALLGDRVVVGPVREELELRVALAPAVGSTLGDLVELVERSRSSASGSHHRGAGERGESATHVRHLLLRHNLVLASGEEEHRQVARDRRQSLGRGPDLVEEEREERERLDKVRDERGHVEERVLDDDGGGLGEGRG